MLWCWQWRCISCFLSRGANVATFEQCLQCQCSQAGCDPTLLFDCVESGFGGVRPCTDPLCAPWCVGNNATAQAVTGVYAGNAWIAGAFGALGGEVTGAGCGCGNQVGTATGPVTPSGAPLQPCGCSGVSLGLGIPWIWVLAIIAFFALVRKK